MEIMFFKEMSMKTIFKLILLAILTFGFLVVSDVLAGDWLGKQEVTNLVSGNTVKGFYLKEGESAALTVKVGIKIKFYDDGRAEQTTHRYHGSKGSYTEKGKWFINKKGALCMKWNNENKKKCGRVKPASDGAYELIRKKQKFVYEEIIPGT
jgi:hypothetical protein